MKNIYTVVRLIAAAIIFLLFVSIKTSAQNEADFSDQPEIIHDSLYYELFKSNRISDPKKALSYALKALELSEKYEHVDILIKAYNAVGWLYQVERKFDSALYYHNSGLEISNKYRRKDRQMYTYNNLGIIYSDLRVFDKSLDFFLKSLKLSQDRHQADLELSCLNNIGIVYLKLNNNTKALSYFKQSLELTKQSNGNLIDETTVNLGFTYIDIGELHEAINTFNTVRNANTNARLKLAACYGLSEAYLKLDNRKKAIEYGFLTLDSAIKLNDKYYQCLSYHTIGKIEYIEKNFHNALQNALKALQLARQIELVAVNHDLCVLIAKILKEQQKFRTAYDFLFNAQLLQDSLNNKDFAENYKNIHLRLAKEETDQIIQNKEAEIEKQAIISKSIAVITILAVILLVVLWRGIVIIKRSRKTIATQNTELSVLNQSLETQVEERTRELALSLEKIRMQNEREQSLLRKELNFLKNQFNSHITFNFLNFCYSKVHRSSPDTAEAIDLFATMLRYSLVNSAEEKVSLKQEIAYIQNFIELQRLLTAEVFVKFTCEGDIENKMILPRILITFIENAFKHGELSNPDEPVRILLRGDPEAISLKVSNRKNRRRHIVNTGVGQENVMQILQLNYPGRHALNIDDGEENYSCQLTITLTDEERIAYPDISIAV